MLDVSLTQEEYGFAFRKGRTDGLRDRFNSVLSRMEKDGTLDAIKQKHEKICNTGKKDEKETRQTLIVLMDPSYPPYEFLKDGQLVGIEVELLKMIAEQLNYNLDIRHESFSAMFSLVQGRKADIAASSISVTPDRQKTVNFTEPFDNTELKVVVRRDFGISSPDQLKGKRIAAVYATTSIPVIRDRFQQTPEIFSDIKTAVELLSNGKVDAAVHDRDVIAYFVSQHPELCFLDESLAQEDYAFALRKGEDYLLEEINTVIRKMVKDGTIRKIKEKYTKVQDPGEKKK